MKELLLWATGAGAFWDPLETVGSTDLDCPPPRGEEAGLFSHQFLHLLLMFRGYHLLGFSCLDTSSPKRAISGAPKKGGRSRKHMHLQVG